MSYIIHMLISALFNLELLLELPPGRAVSESKLWSHYLNKSYPRLTEMCPLLRDVTKYVAS